MIGILISALPRCRAGGGPFHAAGGGEGVQPGGLQRRRGSRQGRGDHQLADEEKSLEMIVQLRGAQKKMVDAAVAKFGDEGKSLYQQGAAAVAVGGGGLTRPRRHVRRGNAKRIDDAEVKTEGDTATVTPRRPVHAPEEDRLRLEGGHVADGRLTRMRRTGHGADDAEDVHRPRQRHRRGKYKSVDEARTAMREKMMALARRGGGGGMRGRPRAGAGAGGASTQPGDK
jgi:hypothetical protein